METPSPNEDRVFNLQLTVQRLEEELSLYRNGTTAEQMFDLVKEKEAEIADLKNSITDKDAKLRKLAKSSTEMLAKFEDLQMANRNTLLQLAEVTKSKELDLKNHILITNEMTKKYDMLALELSAEKEVVLKANETVQERTEQIVQISQQLATKQAHVDHLRAQLGEADQSIEKLQKRCAELVGEKAQKLRILDDERQEMITHVQDFRSNMSANLAQRDEVVQRKNEKIRELKQQLAQSQQEAKQQAQRVTEIQVDRDAFWAQKVQVANLQAQCEDAQRKIDQLEAQRRTWLEAKTENEVAKAKLAHLEERVARYDQQHKRRVLQDTTNTAPVATGAGAGPQGGGGDKNATKNAIRALSGVRPPVLVD